MMYIKEYKTYGKHGYNQDSGGKNASHYKKISEEVVSEIIERLRTSSESSDVIGEYYGVSGRTIRSINIGEYYHRDNEIYPIRNPLWQIKKETSKDKQEMICPICGSLISTKDALCVKCAHEMQRRAERPSCGELAQMVKEFGFECVGRKFDVSGNTIKKWCKSFGIPFRKHELILWLDSTHNTNNPIGCCADVV